MANAENEVVVVAAFLAFPSDASVVGVFPLPYPADLVRVDAALGTVAEGQDFIVNVAKNGTQLWSGENRVILASGVSGASKSATGPVAATGQTIPYRTPNNPVAGTTGAVATTNGYANDLSATVGNASPLASFVAGDRVRIDVDQAGASGTVGENLGVALTFVRK